MQPTKKKFNSQIFRLINSQGIIIKETLSLLIVCCIGRIDCDSFFSFYLLFYPMRYYNHPPLFQSAFPITKSKSLFVYIFFDVISATFHLRFFFPLFFSIPISISKFFDSWNFISFSLFQEPKIFDARRDETTHIKKRVDYRSMTMMGWLVDVLFF